VFDPACYYGHSCADLAMTHLFGGFGYSFYDAYRASVPAGFDDPSLYEIYNLYHLLNHALMFGASYVGRADAIVRRYG
ncbi:MAG: fructosamine kinase family protein, partial [Verrucomicrobiales bacterium]